MNKIRIAKIAGLIGALFASAASFAMGDYTAAIGILGAAFASASAVEAPTR